MLAIFVGNSGVGKDTIMKGVISHDPEKFIKFPSYATRAMRDGESEGNPYNFISKEKFFELRDAGDLYEHNEVHGNQFYGGSYSVLDKYLATGKILLKDVDVEGVRTYKKVLADRTKMIAIFLYCSDRETVLNRLKKRGDSPESILKRSSRFDKEDELACESEYMVNNMTVSVTTAEVVSIIENETAQGGIYLPSFEAGLPSEAEIAKAAEAETFAPVHLVYNGAELLITEGAARYIAAKRSGRFIQKKIECAEIMPELQSIDISYESYLKFVSNR